MLNFDKNWCMLNSWKGKFHNLKTEAKRNGKLKIQEAPLPAEVDAMTHDELINSLDDVKTLMAKGYVIGDILSAPDDGLLSMPEYFALRLDILKAIGFTTRTLQAAV